MKGQKNLLITKLEDIQDFKRKSSGFTREKSDNSVNSRKNKERKKSNFRCKNTTEKKGGT